MGLTWATSHCLWHACKVYAWAYKHMHKHTASHSCVACWQVLRAQGNTSLASTNSPSRLSTSAESNWSTYAEASTIQTMQHPSQGSKGTNCVCTLKTPICVLLQCVWHRSWANNRDWPGQTVMRWIKHLMTYSFVKTRLVCSLTRGAVRMYLGTAVPLQFQELNANSSILTWLQWHNWHARQV